MWVLPSTGLTTPFGYSNTLAPASTLLTVTLRCVGLDRWSAPEASPAYSRSTVGRTRARLEDREYTTSSWTSIGTRSLAPPFFRRETSTAFTRSSATYFIPKAPAGKRLQNAKLRVFVSGRGDFSDFSTLRLNGKSPVAVDPVLCSPATNEFPRGYATCSLWATWDFTEAARALSVQGGRRARAHARSDAARDCGHPIQR